MRDKAAAVWNILRGRPTMYGVRLELYQPVSFDQAGMVIVRCHFVFKGYCNRPDSPVDLPQSQDKQ